MLHGYRDIIADIYHEKFFRNISAMYPVIFSRNIAGIFQKHFKKD